MESHLSVQNQMQENQEPVMTSDSGERKRGGGMGRQRSTAFSKLLNGCSCPINEMKLARLEERVGNPVIEGKPQPQ